MTDVPKPLRGLSIPVNIEGGVSARQAASELAELATRLGVRVTAWHNSRLMSALPGESGDKVYSDFLTLAEITRKAEAERGD